MNALTDRNPASIEEELKDLREYLEQLPAALKLGGAFASYEHRAAELAKLLSLHQATALSKELAPNSYLTGEHGIDSSEALIRVFRDLEAHHKGKAATHSRWDSSLHVVLVASSALSVLGTGILTLPMSVVSVSLAATLAFARFSERARREQRVADHLGEIWYCISLLGQESRILKPIEYYDKNMRQIEELIAEVKSETRLQRAKRV